MPQINKLRNIIMKIFLFLKIATTPSNNFWIGEITFKPKREENIRYTGKNFIEQTANHWQNCPLFLTQLKV